MNKILFVDLLATGTNPSKCGIYAIGGILCEDSLSEIKELERFEFRIKPYEGARIVDNSLWIGGITRSDLLRFQNEPDALEDLIKLLAKHVDLSNPEDKVFICGFNSSAFDLPFIKELFERNGNRRFRDCFHMQSIDVMTLSAYALMSERSKMREFNLSSVSRKLGIVAKTSEEYACLDGAETCAMIYRKLKERLKTGEYGEYLRKTEVISNF